MPEIRIQVSNGSSTTGVLSVDADGTFLDYSDDVQVREVAEALFSAEPFQDYFSGDNGTPTIDGISVNGLSRPVDPQV